ncbi:two-component system regulatory protein YycI [Enterococcus sp. DIV0660C]|uniref:two-component system regulatory protein YycI n=1 Tax=Enterococcus sp. DIV0660C TaxID=2230880 RepID=UPI001A8F5305|nr:two-component system regulatory protein YycI [Enterococcus sp. DIV0660C]
MDFKKIEWIFFLAFLGLNIFLFSSYHEAMNQENNVIRSDQTESIQNRLASDDISYSGNISSESKQGYYLSAEQSDLGTVLTQHRKKNSTGLLRSGITFDGLSTLTKTFATEESEKYKIDNKQTKHSITEFLNSQNNVLYGDEYEFMTNFSTLDGDSLEIQASQSYEGIPFHDDTAEINFMVEKDDGVYQLTKYTQTHLTNIEQLREKMDLYSEEEAIQTLYVNNKIPSSSKILWRQLAYSCIVKVREKNVYVPIWYVAIETSDKSVQIESVNAFSNTIVTNNVVPKVEDN